MRLGEWGADLSTKELQAFVEQCLEMGLNDFDHADIYGHYSTEAQFGAVLKQDNSLRDKVQITTKCGIKMLTPRRPNHKIKSYDSSPQHIISSIEQSLQELNTDYIDVLLLHRPDYLSNPEEIAVCIETLKEQGKIKEFGVSNYNQSQFDLLNSYTPLVTNQIEASLWHIDPLKDGVLDQCIKLGVKPTAWSPIGGGAIFSVEKTKQNQRIHMVASELADRYACGIDTILLAWLMKHPAGVIPVVGTSKIERISSALTATKIELSHEEWYELLQAATGEEVA